MVDNLKSAVLQRLAGVAPVFNPRYLDFARHHGFAIPPCNVARGNEKGRVESGVGYVKKNFLRGLELSKQPHRSGSTPSPTCASTGRRNNDPSICSRRSVRI
jgi:transposase